MAKLTITEQELKEREVAMRTYLSELPAAKNASFIFAQTFLDEMTALEKTLNKLKAFINFLSKLNPMQYLRWMQSAYAQYTAPTGNLSFGEDADHEETFGTEPSTLQSWPSSTPKKRAKKKKLPMTRS